MAQVCRVWEASARQVAETGIRTVILRIGVVLSPRSGALHKLLHSSPLGVVRRFGTGRQIISWISLDDAVAAMYHAMCSEHVSGAVNIVAPNPVTNSEFCQAVAKISGKPPLVPLPGGLLKAVYGDMAQEILLAGSDVSCEKLVASGYIFRHNTLLDALRDMFGQYDLSEIQCMEA